MSRPTVLYDSISRKWPRGLIAAGAAIATAAGVFWWPAAPELAERAPVAQPVSWAATPSPFAPMSMTAAEGPATAPAGAAVVMPTPSSPISAAPRPIPTSTLVAPGVHITPMSVPPSTERMPAGLREGDTESEN